MTTYIVAEYRNGGWLFGDYQIECETIEEAREVRTRWANVGARAGIFAAVPIETH